MSSLFDADTLWLQSRLRELGYDPGPLDGLRGPKTDAAVVAFKRSVGLRARPFVGPLTRLALKQAETTVKSSIPWMAEAAKIRGIHEVRDYSRLRAWFAEATFDHDPREVPWCGGFVASCLRLWEAGADIPATHLAARAWRHWGKRVDPVFGSVLVFWRGSRDGWQGHVGFYHAEDQTHFHVLGGNQTNAVTVSRISKARLLDARWPAHEPVRGRPIWVSAGGVPVTENEA